MGATEGFGGWGAVRRKVRECAAIGRACAIAAWTLIPLSCSGGWVEARSNRVSDARRMGATRSELARVAARAHGLAGQVFSDSLGLWRDRAEAGERREDTNSGGGCRC